MTESVEDLAELILLVNEIAKQQGLYVGLGKDLNKPDTWEAQVGPHWNRITEVAERIVKQRSDPWAARRED